LVPHHSQFHAFSAVSLQKDAHARCRVLLAADTSKRGVEIPTELLRMRRQPSPVAPPAGQNGSLLLSESEQ
jgi:hypothetical protein